MVLFAFLWACGPDVGVSAVGDAEAPPGVEDEGVVGGETGSESLDDAPAAGFPFDRDEIQPVSLYLSPESVDGLRYEGDYVLGRLEVDGLETEVGVRLKGASTFDTLKNKPSLKLAFDAFTPHHRFLGFEHLTFNAMKYDKTMMREAVAYRLYGQVDAPASRHGFASLTINGEPYGVYSIIETADEHLLARLFPGDHQGNLYDTYFTSSDLTDIAAGTYDLQEGDPATALTDIRELVDALDSGNINDVLAARFDYEATMNFLATDLATANYDGYSRNTNNYLLYHATESDRWAFLPWGQDTAFGGSGPLYNAVRGRVAAACQRDTTCRAALEEHIRALLEVWESEDLLGWTTDMAAIIGPACEADPRKNEECDQESILEKVEDRPSEVRFYLGE